MAWQFEEYYLARGGIGTWHTRFSHERPDEGRPDIRYIRPLAAPPPAQAAGVTEEIARMALDALNGVIRLSEMGFEESLREPEEKGNFAAYNRAREARDRIEASLSAQDREE